MPSFDQVTGGQHHPEMEQRENLEGEAFLLFLCKQGKRKTSLPFVRAASKTVSLDLDFLLPAWSVQKPEAAAM